MRACPDSKTALMSAISKRLIKRYYTAFNASDRDALLGMLTDDVVHDLNQSQREVGRDAFVKFMARMNDCYREQVEDIAVFSDNDGHRAAAEFTVVGTYLKTDEGLPAAHGQTYRIAAGAFFEIHDGKIARVTHYYNLQGWLKQVQ